MNEESSLMSLEALQDDDETNERDAVLVEDHTEALNTLQPYGTSGTDDTPQLNDAMRTQGTPNPDEIPRTLDAPRTDSVTKDLGMGDNTYRTSKDTSFIKDEWSDEYEGDKENKIRKKDSWSHHDFQPDWIDEESEGGSGVFEERSAKVEAADESYPGIENEDGKIQENRTHGYTLIDTTEIDEKGHKKIIREFLPRIHQRIRTYKKMFPMTIKFTKLINDVDLIEEEEDINEEMEVDEITSTCLVKHYDESGEEVLEEKKIVQEVIKHPGKKWKYMKLKMINDLDDEVEELIQLDGDQKRTNEIIQLAAPYLRRKTKILEEGLKQDEADIQAANRDSTANADWDDWVKHHDAERVKILNNAILNLKKALDQQKVLKRMNKALGKQLCHHYDLRGKKELDFNHYENKGSMAEREENYQCSLLEFNDVAGHIFKENEVRDKWVRMSSEDIQRDADKLTQLRQQFYDLEASMVNHITSAASESQSHRSMTYQELIEKQKLMDQNLTKIRFECNKSEIILAELKCKEAKLKQGINNMEGVDFISFEALRKKTKDLNDKLDLKDKQMIALKDKMTERAQALAHLRMKINILSRENKALRKEKEKILIELEALRTEKIKVQQKRRQMEKHLNKCLKKEGLEKYPFLLKDANNPETTEEEGRELISELASKCSEMKSIVQKKLDEHRKGVEKYREIKDKRRKKKKFFSLGVNSKTLAT